jgi:hypothetical protein
MGKLTVNRLSKQDREAIENEGIFLSGTSYEEFVAAQG